MNKKEFLDKYKGKAVHCPTEDLANEFLELCDKFEIKWWCVGNKATEYSYWNRHTEETCYRIDYDNTLIYDIIYYYKSENIEIIEFKKEKTMKFKDILKNKALLEKEVPAEILKMLGLKKKGFEIGERYCFVSYCGEIGFSTWENCEVDIHRLKHCYASKTEEECIFKKEKQEVLAELREFAEENNTEEIDWKIFSQQKWFILYEFGNEIIGYSYTISWKRINEIYFTSEQLAQQAVAKVGEDRIKKYLFGVGGVNNGNKS